MIGKPNWSEQVMPVSLTVDQIRSFAPNRPQAARRHEGAVTENEWLCRCPLPGALALTAPMLAPVAICDTEAGDPDLRSTEHVIGYEIHARDGKIGHVCDFVVDDENWRIRYFAVATGNWSPGNKVLVTPDWVESVSPEARELAVALSRSGVRACPEYDPLEPVNREYEVRRYDYCGRPRDGEQSGVHHAVW
jgi:hypothetical protein